MAKWIKVHENEYHCPICGYQTGTQAKEFCYCPICGTIVNGIKIPAKDFIKQLKRKIVAKGERYGKAEDNITECALYEVADKIESELNDYFEIEVEDEMSEM